MLRSPSNAQIHILVGCSDARDVGRVHLEVVEATRAEYLSRGIRSELYVLRTPGSFASADVLTDIEHIVAATQRELEDAARTRYFVHVQSHGELTLSGPEEYRCGLHHVGVKHASVFNCGMLAATEVAVELERLIIELAPIVELIGSSGAGLRVDSEEAIRQLLRLRYGYDGYLAGDWIKSVDDLRTHTRLQKAALERAVATDPQLRGLDIQVTAGIQDYRRNAYVRVDGGEPEAGFWDEGQRRINERLAALPRDAQQRARQAESQQPLVGLLAMSDIRGARARALARVAQLGRSRLPPPDYEPNTVFAMSGSSFDLPAAPFGPYVLAGLFYSVKALRLRRYLVMGNDEAQTHRMVRKVRTDPIARLLVEHFGVELIPVLAGDLA